MNNVIRVYGASDDLIEVDGAIREEFSAYGLDEDDGGFLAFNDGTVLEIHYGASGRWRISCVQEGVASYEKSEATSDEGRREDDPDVPAYSDLVTLTISPDLMQGYQWVEGLMWRWCMFGKFAKAES